MGFIAALLNYIPACRSELKLSIMKSISIVETVEEVTAVCESFLDGVVIFDTFLDSKLPPQLRLNAF